MRNLNWVKKHLIRYTSTGFGKNFYRKDNGRVVVYQGDRF